MLADPRRFARRLRCHGSLWCCQYVDDPMCNSARDPHHLGHWHWHLMQRKVEADFGASEAVQPEGDKIDSTAEALGVPDGQP